MGQPKYRLSISNKDKSERTFTDYQGKERTSKYQTIGAIFENEDGRLSATLDKKVTLDPDKVWLNVYVVEAKDDDEDDKPKVKKAAKSKVKKQTKKAPPPDDEDDDTDPFADDE